MKTLCWCLSTFFLKVPTDEDCIICLPEHQYFVSRTNNKVVKEIIGEGELAYLDNDLLEKYELFFTNFRNLNQLRKQLCYM